VGETRQPPDDHSLAVDAVLDAEQRIFDQPGARGRDRQLERDLTGERAVGRPQPGARLVGVVGKRAKRDAVELDDSREAIGFLRGEILAAASPMRERAARDDESRHFVARQYAALDDLAEHRSRNSLGDEAGDVECRRYPSATEPFRDPCLDLAPWVCHLAHKVVQLAHGTTEQNVKPTFFKTPAAFRKWLEKSHDKADELLVGYYKKDSGKPSITWPESVDEALCFGWIDGIRRTIDDESYSIRFTPRRARSVWSNVNTKRFAELEKQGRMHESGRRAFSARDAKRSGIYSFEQRNKAMTLAPEYERMLQSNAKAWAFLQSQAPYYQRIASLYVMSAKKDETRLRRLARLIDDSAKGRRIGIMEKKKDADRR
jgi:uncharacterized protein YdeI (YjbR/CyaY-like superfamily)